MNIAARIVPLSEPGGVCLSETVAVQVKNQLEFPCEKLPRATLKNIDFPIEVFRIELPWEAGTRPGTAPWTGRSPELRIAEDLLRRVLQRESSMLVLTGEAGIGKTRLAEEVIKRGTRLQFQTLRGGCARGEPGAPYSPWIQAARMFSRDAPMQRLYRACGSAANVVVRLLPELVEKIGPVPPLPEGAADQERFRLYDGITQFFVNIADSGPLLLFIDDLQWADPASIRLLEYLARNMVGHPVLLVGAFREAEVDEHSALRPLLLDLGRERVATTIALKRFDASELSALIAGFLPGVEAPVDFRDHLLQRTSGNPLFVEEVLRSVVEEGMAHPGAVSWDRRRLSETAIPESIQEVLRRRVSRLPEGSQSVLRTATVLGAEFDPELLAQVAETEEPAFLEAYDQTLRLGLFTERRGTGGRVTCGFTDRLARDMLYGELSSLRRRRIHLRVAERLEQASIARPEEAFSALAYHYLEGGDLRKARDYAVRAADAAAALSAHEEVAHQLESAREILIAEPEPSVQARVLDRLGHAYLNLGRPHDAIQQWMPAAELYARLGQTQPAGELYQWIGRTYRLNPDIDPEPLPKAVVALQAGERLLGAGTPSRELGLLLEEYATLLAEVRRFSESRAMCERARAVARSTGAADVEMLVNEDLAMTAGFSEIPAAIEGLEREVEHFTRGPEGAFHLGVACRAMALAQFYLRGDPAGAIRWYERALTTATAARDRGSEVRLRGGMLARFLLWSGRWAEAEQQLDLAEALSRRLGTYLGAPSRLARAELEIHRGNLERAEALLENSLPGPSGRWYTRDQLLLVRLRVRQGNSGAAVRLLRELLAATSESGLIALHGIDQA
ncbi:MAG: AAA family ATPase, partial [Thermoplasmata archaeon]